MAETCMTTRNTSIGLMYFHRDNKAYSKGLSHCKDAHDAGLALLKNKDSIMSAVKHSQIVPSDCKSHYYYIGLTRSESQSYIWSDGTPYNDSLGLRVARQHECVALQVPNGNVEEAKLTSFLCVEKLPFLCFTPRKLSTSKPLHRPTEPTTTRLTSLFDKSSSPSHTSNLVPNKSVGLAVGLAVSLVVLVAFLAAFVVLKRRRNDRCGCTTKPIQTTNVIYTAEVRDSEEEFERTYSAITNQPDIGPYASTPTYEGSNTMNTHHQNYTETVECTNDSTYDTIDVAEKTEKKPLEECYAKINKPKKKKESVVYSVVHKSKNFMN